MDQIVEQLINLNKKDCLDIVGILLPIILTVVIILQNRVYSIRTDELEKQIYNRDQINHSQSHILAIYNTYYVFCDTILTSGFDNNVKIGNVNLAHAWINNLITMRLSIGRNLDLAKLMFEKSNKELYLVIEERFRLSIKIIDKYMEYINSGKLYDVSENAWEMIIKSNQETVIYKYNYQMLAQNKRVYDNFVKLCKSEQFEEIQNLIKEYQEKHTYDNFDKYFEGYFSLEKL